jgi:hypothetical protein
MFSRVQMNEEFCHNKINATKFVVVNYKSSIKMNFEKNLIPDL